jgi:hypothetical protein
MSRVACIDMLSYVILMRAAYFGEGALSQWERNRLRNLWEVDPEALTKAATLSPDIDQPISISIEKKEA